MQKRMMGAVLVTAGLIAGVRAQADPLDIKTVPADAKWILHVDAEAIQKSAVWPTLQQRIAANPVAQQHIKELRAITGMTFPQDLFSVTIYGGGFNERDGVVVVHGRANQEQVFQLLEMNPYYSAQSYSTHDVLSWADKGKVMYGALFGADRAIISQSQQNVEMALDVLDGKAASLKVDSAFARLADAGVMVGIAGEGLSELARRHKAQSPVVNLIESAWLTLGSDQQHLLLRARVLTLDAQKAEQMRGALEGFKNMGLLLTSSNARQDSRAELLSRLLPSLGITVQGTAVQLDWPVSIDSLKDLATAPAQPKLSATSPSSR